MAEHEYTKIAMAISNNNWDENPTVQEGKYNISQFHGTAFVSDYACYKVQWLDPNDGGADMMTGGGSATIVAKRTNMKEANILQMLSEKQLPVPEVKEVLSSNRGGIMVFMEHLPGVELYAITEHNAWIRTAKELATIHSQFWVTDVQEGDDIPNIRPSNVVLEKIKRVQGNTAHNGSWKAYMDMVRRRLSTAPKTLVHGDMFPTNILVNGGELSFIDWADAGMFAYMMDIGRLTAMIDKDTLRPMCPCAEEVIRAYFEMIHVVLGISYDEYLRDVYMAQFIELANYYSPPGILGCNEVYNQLIERCLHEIVEHHFR